MNDTAKPPTPPDPRSTDKEPPSPDDLVHMYGGSIFFIAIPLVLIALVVWYFLAN